MTSSFSTAPNSDGKVEIINDDFGQYDLNFKLIIIGDAGVGKSSGTSKATRDTFNSAYSATIGFEFFSFSIKINDKIVKLQIWDTCGQEVYRSLISNFYRNSSGAIMVYAINNKQSYDNIDSWLKEGKINSNPDAKVFLIGNKNDLENEREVSGETAKRYSQDLGGDYFVESSEKTGFNAKDTFIEAAKVLYFDYLKYKEINPPNSEVSDFVYLSHKNESNKAEKKKCAC